MAKKRRKTRSRKSRKHTTRRRKGSRGRKPACKVSVTKKRVKVSCPR